MSLITAIMPKEDGYFDMFTRHSEAILGGAQAMARLFAGTQAIDGACSEIARYEQGADVVAEEVLHAVRRSFITPFDRSAIKDLISSMDDAVDEMHKTAKAVLQYEVDPFEPEMSKLAALAEQAARLLVEAVPLLRSVGRNHEALNAITQRIVGLEEDADRLHETGLTASFRAHRTGNAMDYIVTREIYDRLEKVLDRFEDVANEIQGIVIDHA